MVTRTEFARSEADAARSKRRLLAGVAVGLLVVLAVAGWWEWSSRSADQLALYWTPTCQGSEVSRYTKESAAGVDEELQGQYVIDARPGFRCDISLTIHNSSRWPAHLTSITAPLAGPSGGAEFVAVADRSSDALAPANDHGIDATFPLDQELAAGDSITFDVVLAWRESGCNSGGYLWEGGWPTVNFDLLGLGHAKSSAQFVVLHTYDHDHQSRPNSNC